MYSLLTNSWKAEPLSPPSIGDEGAVLPTEQTFYPSWDPFSDVDVKLEDGDLELALCENKAQIASHILENLEHLVDLDELIKEDSYLLDEKILPLLDGSISVEAPCAVPVSLQATASRQLIPLKNEDHGTTQYLLTEFESVYDRVGLGQQQTTSLTPLTPPQSPPRDVKTTPQPVLLNLEPIPTTTHGFYGSAVLETNIAPNDYTSGGSSGTYSVLAEPQVQVGAADIAHELAVVDELVRSRVEDMQWSTRSSYSPPSPAGDSHSSCSSNFGDCSGSSSEDQEWLPEALPNSGNLMTSPKGGSRKRTRTSKTAPEEKKVRKKEQNKNAATRYRLKKKAEVEEILTEEKALLNRKNDLNGNITDLEREIKYLKGLMRDLFKAKGLIN